MATDGPTPPNCDTEVYKHGSHVGTVDGSSNAVEKWVKTIAKESNARVDWHYIGGRANVLHLGNKEDRKRVLETMHKLVSSLKGTLMEISAE